MKGIIFLWMLIGFCLTTTFGQVVQPYSKLLAKKQNKLDIGIELGPSLVYIEGNSFLVTSESRIFDASFLGGISLQYNFPKFLSIKSGVLFDRKGGANRFRGVNAVGNIDRTIIIRKRFDYLVVPVLFKLTELIPNSKLSLFVNVGASANFLLRTEQTEQIDPVNPVLPIFKSTVTSFKSPTYFDLAIILGGGIEIPIQNKWVLIVETRVNLGLFNILDLHGWTGDPDRFIENRGFDADFRHGSTFGTAITRSTNLLIGIAYKLGDR